MTIKLRVSGEWACFTRPEMKVERVSYDTITPSAAVGVLEAVYWKPAIRWHVKSISVLKPIRFQSFRTNEVDVIGSSANALQGMKKGVVDKLSVSAADNRTQRTSLVLADVDYVIEAYFTLTNVNDDMNTAKHASIFNRRASQGQSHHQPSLGLRQFDARFALVEDASQLPKPIQETRDLGFMLHHIDHASQVKQPAFFRAKMVAGVIAVPSLDSPEVVR
jgi:CRISPR-associated protein Cas5d